MSSIRHAIPLRGRVSDYGDGVRDGRDRYCLMHGTPVASPVVKGNLIGDTPAARLLDLYAKRRALGFPVPETPYEIADEPKAKPPAKLTAEEHRAARRARRLSPVGQLGERIYRCRRQLREASTDAVREHYETKLERLIAERAALKGGGA